MKSIFQSGFLGLVICVMTASVHADSGRAQPRPLAVEDAVHISEFPAQGHIASVSPDGQWLAYAVTDTRRKPEKFNSAESGSKNYKPGGFKSLYVQGMKTGERIALDSGLSSSWSPVWSPDGKQLAFYSDRDGAQRLWIWDGASRRARRVTDAVVNTLLDLEQVLWTPDGRTLIVKLKTDTQPTGAVKAATVLPDATVSVYRASAASAIDERTSDADDFEPAVSGDSDLAAVDVASGAVRRLSTNIRVTGYWLSPDGTQVAYMPLAGNKRNTSRHYYDLRVSSLADGATRTVAQRIAQSWGRNVSWSPDGKWLAYVTDQRAAAYLIDEVSAGDAYVVAAQGGEPRKLTGKPDPNFSDEYHSPLWSPDAKALLLVGNGRLWRAALDGQRATPITPVAIGMEVKRLVPAWGGIVAWSPDSGRSVIVTTLDEKTQHVGFARVDLKSGRSTQLLEENKYYGYTANLPLVDRSGSAVVYLAQDAQHAADIWRADSALRDRRQVTHANPQLEGYSFGASRLIEYRSKQGENLQGALVLPTNYRPGVRYPLVVRLYQGMWGKAVNRFGMPDEIGWNAQLFATRGYAVLWPSAPLRLGTPMRDLADTVLPAIDRAVELGIVDAERVGVSGHSYGGYSTLSMIVQSPRFKAAVASDGFYDLAALYGLMFDNGQAGEIGVAESGGHFMGSHPWDVRQRYIDNSPYFFLDRIQTPLLLIHGEQDYLPASQADAVFVGLRRLGKEVEYRRYKGEPHSVGENNPANAVDVWTRALEWFERHLKR